MNGNDRNANKSRRVPHSARNQPIDSIESRRRAGENPPAFFRGRSVFNRNILLAMGAALRIFVNRLAAIGTGDCLSFVVIRRFEFVADRFLIIPFGIVQFVVIPALHNESNLGETCKNENQVNPGDEPSEHCRASHERAGDAERDGLVVPPSEPPTENSEPHVETGQDQQC
jgi:hypothetical protein